MLVSELIDLLMKMPKDAAVIADSYGSLAPVRSITLTETKCVSIDAWPDSEHKKTKG